MEKNWGDTPSATLTNTKSNFTILLKYADISMYRYIDLVLKGHNTLHQWSVSDLCTLIG